jgi:hypothetical protein
MGKTESSGASGDDEDACGKYIKCPRMQMADSVPKEGSVHGRVQDGHAHTGQRANGSEDGRGHGRSNVHWLITSAESVWGFRVCQIDFERSGNKRRKHPEDTHCPEPRPEQV